MDDTCSAVGLTVLEASCFYFHVRDTGKEVWVGEEGDRDEGQALRVNDLAGHLCWK